MSEPVLFGDAKIGDEAYTYESPWMDEYGWVGNLEYFDDRSGEVTVTRKRWKLVEVEEVVLPDPWPIDDDEDEPALAAGEPTGGTQ